MQAGIPMNSIDVLQRIFNLGRPYSMAGRTTMATEYIPVVHRAMKHRLKNELADRDVSICFDGTGFFGEAFAVVARFVDDRGIIQERLLRLRMLDETMDGKKISKCVEEALLENEIKGNRVLFFDSDGASANKAAFIHLDYIYEWSHHIICISHTLNNAGKTHKLEILKKFLLYWNAVFSHSTNAKEAWKNFSGSTAQPTASNTRWWASYEQVLYLHSRWSYVLPFLRSKEIPFSVSARQSVIDFLFLHEREVRMQMAALVDVADKLVKITYFIEGELPLAVALHQCVKDLCLHLNDVKYEELDKLLAAYPPEAPGNDERQEIIHALQPVITHFQNRFGIDNPNCEFRESLDIFEAATLANPASFCLVYGDGGYEKLNRIRNMVTRFKWNSPDDVHHLIDEAKQYFQTAVAEGVPGLNRRAMLSNLPAWWHTNLHLPAWHKFALRIFLMQPSSASVERVFSILAGSFGKDQSSSLSDYLEAALMMKVNVPRDVDLRHYLV